MLPLGLLETGQTGRVFEVAGDPSLVHRLSEIGIREGTLIRMVQRGSPCIIALDDQRFSLRTDDEDLVLVEVVGES